MELCVAQGMAGQRCGGSGKGGCRHTLLICVYLDSASTVFSSTAARNNHLKLMACVCIKLLNRYWSLNAAHPNCCLLPIYSLSEIPQGFFSVAGVR